MATKYNNRNIRLSDSEWEAFKTLLGPEWLRARIRGALLAKKRKENTDARERGLTE